PHAVAAIRLLVLTGCRLREILHLRWQDVDLERRLLRLPDSKTGAKLVYLNAPAMEVLANVPRTRGFVYVIEGRKPKSPRADLNTPWRRIRKQAGLDDVRLHDLRHTHAAVGAGLGLSLPMIGKLLGHTLPTTTARYAHLAVDPMHEAAERIGAALAASMDVGEKTRSPERNRQPA
ncbi:MAG: site-specific integrase, partial [bacterium]|nr:site-specific integrase [bacterium]